MRNLLRLLYSWWTSDRIRASPSQGRHLSLGPGAVLVIAGEPARVFGRRADCDGVHYLCESAIGACEVFVRSDGFVVLCSGDCERSLDGEQVEAYPGPACSRPFNF